VRRAGGIGAAIVLGLVTGVGAQDEPSRRDRITFTVNDRIRGEFVDWFTPHEGKAEPGAERYNFVANRFRAGVRVLLPPAELNLQLQDTELANLPENASLPAPIGNLGTGAIYFANRRSTPQGEVFLKQGTLTVRGRGLTATFGRFEYRDGLEVVLLWIGGMKFTTYEAEGIKPMVANSPLMGWVYGVMSVTAFSALLGVIEIAIAALIALRPVWPAGSAVGSGLAVGMFLTTFSFLFTTPGWEPSLGGFPAVSAMPGQFVLKDIVLLGVALWTAGEALSAARTGRAAASAAEPGAAPDRRGT
jgi:uncharacterized membrane protein YkgB